MPTILHHAVVVGLITACMVLSPLQHLHAQSATRDAIGDLLETARSNQTQRIAGNSTESPVATTAGAEAASPAETAPDPRSGNLDYEQAKALMAAIDSILKDTADLRSDAAKLPSRDEFVLPPLWAETREARNEKVRALLDSALGIVTDVPVVEVQKKVDDLRKEIRSIEDQNAGLKEQQINAPQEAMLPGVLNDTVQSIQTRIDSNAKLIDAKRDEIKAAKAEISSALRASGVELQADQIDLLLDSVLSGDLVRLVAVFNAAKAIDAQLGRMIGATGENMNAARKYFAMHAALFAMLVQAQDATITKIDTQYMPKLDAIIADIKSARAKTTDLLRAENRPDQKRALDANRDSQKLADDAAKAYRRYIQQQRQQIASARNKATHDLRIADNTFETVEASVQLRNLMRESTSSFEAIQKLEAPSFEQIFKNDELRREFENLTRKLDAPSS